MWRYAAALSAASLDSWDRAAVLERWAGHMASAEGRPWAAVGVLVAAGALRSAVLLLRKVRLGGGVHEACVRCYC